MKRPPTERRAREKRTPQSHCQYSRRSRLREGFKVSFHKKRSDPQHSTEAVERRRASQAEARRAQTAAGQEIGDIPPCADPLRRERCEQYFANFDVVYFPHIFSRPFSKDLRAVCAKIERVVKYGECLAHAMPRGAGKTSLSQAAILWGILCWGHKFAILIDR